MRLLLALLFVLVSVQARAGDKYVCDCQTGFSDACVAGSDAANGTSSATPKQTLSAATTFFNALLPGESLRFCNGGYWSGSTFGALRNTNSTAGAGTLAAGAVAMDAYTPSWGSVVVPKIFENGTNNSLIQFHAGGTVANGGYIVRNIALLGGGTTGGATRATAHWGISVARDLNGLLIDNVLIDGFTIGVNCFGDATYHSRRVSLINSTISNSLGQGSLWGCDDGRIHNNVWSKNGGEQNLDHQLYLATVTPSGQKTNLYITKNSFVLNEGFSATGVCISTVVVGHGVADGILFENNTMVQASGNKANGACFGFDWAPSYTGEAEVVRNLVVRGNTAANLGGAGFGCAGCIAPKFESNKCVMEDARQLDCINAPAGNVEVGTDAATSNVSALNNTCYFSQPVAFDSCVNLSNAYNNDLTGSASVVHGNVAYFGTNSNANGHYGFVTTNLTAGNFANYSHNTVYDASGNALFDSRTASGGSRLDTNALTTNPLFVTTPTSANGWDLTIQSSSPSKASALTANSAQTDSAGCARPNPPSRGATDYFASACRAVPATPTGVR